MKVTSDDRDGRLRAMLQLVITETQRQLKSIKKDIQSSSDDRRAVGDVTDDMARETELASATAQSTLLSSRLSAAQEALRRLVSCDGTYGFCDDCGGTISEVRLQALPFAARCITCQENAENVHALSRRQTVAHFSA